MEKLTKEMDLIFNEIVSQGGSDESARVYTVTHIKTGETEVVIEKTITERYPVQEMRNVLNLYERLTCGQGRRGYKLEELAHQDKSITFKG